MTILNKDQILSSDDLPTEVVPVPEWGGEVVIRSLTGVERDEFEAAVMGSKSGGDIDIRGLKCRLISLTAVDGEGGQMFTNGDIELLGGKSAKVLNRLFEVSQRLSGLTEDDVEELVGN